VPNHLGVAHPCLVFVGFEFGKLGHVDAISPTADNFPQIVIGRETIEIDE
jgi:hypothetical protein